MLLERSFIAIEQGNFSFCLRNSRIILEILVFWGLGGVFYGILEFSASLRESKATEEISRNSKFLVILELDPRISIGNSRLVNSRILRFFGG